MPEPAGIIHVEGAQLVTSEQRDRRTLDVAVAGFLARYRVRTTRASYAVALEQWFAFCAEHFVDPLHAQRAHVELWARSLEEHQGLALSTVANKLNALSGFYRLAVADDICAKDPMVHVRRPTIDRVSPRQGLSRTEFADLLTEAEKRPKDHALVCVLGLNGLRVSECLGIDIERLDRHHGQMVTMVTRKGGKQQPIPFAPRTAWALEQLIGERKHGPVFLSRGGNRLDTAGAGRIVKRCAKAAGITKAITPHGLRHSFVTMCRDAGVPDADITASTGHADTRMVDYYDRHRQSIARNATHAVAAFVERTL